MFEDVVGVNLRKMVLHALAILLLSLAATFAAWRWTAQQGEALERIRFEQVATEARDEFGDRMASYNQVLRSGVALLETRGEVSREEWRRFFVGLDVERLYPGTQGVGYAVKVQPDEWREHEQRVRAEGFPAYAIKPAVPRPVAFPIVYIEPFGGRNLRAFGYDMFSEPVRREAMTRARDTGLPSLSGKVVLVQESGAESQPGVLLYLPYYHEDVLRQRGPEDAIAGFVYSPLRMGDLVRAVLGERLNRICLTLYDQEEAPENLLFSNEDHCRRGNLVTHTALDVFGRRWVFHVRSTPALDDSIANQRSGLILAAGSVISLLLVWAVMSMVAERQRRVALGRALADLEQARAEAAGALAAKGRFLAAASHDLRQPLQSLGLFLHAMIERRGPPGEVERAAQQAYEATARLVEAMFDAAALESGRAKPAIQPVNVAELIESICQEHRPEAESRGLFLRSRLCPVTVQTDKVMLERIVRNLVNNALKYTDKGGILVACRATPHTVRIKVSDSGPGIPKDKQQLIFEDFYQLENPERDPRKGLGLGLATVARTARALGYRLRVLSRQGVGSTFVVEIPREP